MLTLMALALPLAACGARTDLDLAAARPAGASDAPGAGDAACVGDACGPLRGCAPGQGVTVLATDAWYTPDAIEVDGEHVYYIRQDGIARVKKTGGSGELVVPRQAGSAMSSFALGPSQVFSAHVSGGYGVTRTAKDSLASETFVPPWRRTPCGSLVGGSTSRRSHPALRCPSVGCGSTARSRSCSPRSSRPRRETS